MFEGILIALGIVVVAFSIILILVALAEPPNMEPKACMGCGSIYHAVVLEDGLCPLCKVAR